ncbi:dihydropteroate synthase [Candidatus Thorarchaeota archaeon]|nr:MAG: dihydropteroate synthase [Candidatus Thorarchaeota archaeon]
MRSHHVDIAGLRIGEGYPVRTMGVINLSSESFYKGSVAIEKNDLQQSVDKMESDGADIIDIGGASTAPKNVYNTPDISEDKEIQRVNTALKIITDRSNIPISIDTVSSRVAAVALDLGANIINDTSGLKADANMAKLASSRESPIVLMANCLTPCQSLRTTLESLSVSLTLARKYGINNERIIVDPGIGFGKPPEIDCMILGELDHFLELNHPVLVGISRKAFIGSILEQPDPSERLIGSLAATSIAVYQGVSVIRTHDVRETRMAIKIGESIRGKKIISQDRYVSDEE